MTQATTTLQIRATSATAFAHMMERMSRLPPRRFSPFTQPDAEDLQDGADILRCHIRAFADYVSAYMADYSNSSWHVHLDRLYVDGMFENILGDCCGTLENAADRAREEGTWRAA